MHAKAILKDAFAYYCFFSFSPAFLTSYKYTSKIPNLLLEKRIRHCNDDRHFMCNYQNRYHSLANESLQRVQNLSGKNAIFTRKLSHFSPFDRFLSFMPRTFDIRQE